MDMDEITEFGKMITDACVVLYDMVNTMVNDTGIFSTNVGMSATVKDSDNGKSYRYNVKIEKEEIKND